MAEFQVPRWCNVQDISFRSFSFMFAITNVICFVILRSRAICKNLLPFQMHVKWQQEVIFASWIQQFRILAFLFIQHSYNLIIILKFILLCIFLSQSVFFYFVCDIIRGLWGVSVLASKYHFLHFEIYTCNVTTHVILEVNYPIINLAMLNAL